MENEKLKVDNSPSSSLSLSKCEGVGCETARGSANLKTNSHSVLTSAMLSTSDTESPKNVPKIRFKGCNSTYKRYKFSDIFLFSTGKNIKQNEASPEFKTPCIRYGELYHMYSEVVTKVINRTDLETDDLLFSYGDEILLPSAGEDPLDIGSASALMLKNIAIGRTINILRPAQKNTYSQIYVSYYINNKLRKNISKLARGSSISNVYNSDLKKLKINLPTLPEQQKIADCLSTWDESIENAKLIIENKKLYKKGMMQKIFSQEIRFKDDTSTPLSASGADYPDWVESRVRDLFEITRGHVLPVTKISDKKTDIYKYPVYSSQTKRNGLTGFFDTYLYENSITWTTDGANAGDVNLRKGKFYCTNVCGVLISENGYANECLAQILNSISHKHVSYIGNPKLMNNTMGEIKITIPRKLQEQTKIANFLSAIDDEIEILESQLAELELQKKGLMQGMFV